MAKHAREKQSVNENPPAEKSTNIQSTCSAENNDTQSNGTLHHTQPINDMGLDTDKTHAFLVKEEFDY